MKILGGTPAAAADRARTPQSEFLFPPGGTARNLNIKLRMSNLAVSNCLIRNPRAVRRALFSPFRPVLLLVQHSKALLGGMALGSGMLVTMAARAQGVSLDFPVSAASGYDQQLGVTVQSRPRPLYDTPSVRLGGFEVRPQLDQTFAYNSNPTGASSDAKGSFLSQTSANVAVSSLWSRNSLATTAGVDHYQYFSLAGGSYTDWNMGLQGGYTIADSQITAAYSHSNYHQLGATIGTVRSDQPVADSTDTTRLNYTLKFNRLEITPEFDFGAYRYGEANIGQVRLDQNYLNRNVFAGSVTARYAFNDVGGVVTVARAIDSQFLHNFAGSPTNDSRQYQLLSGLDYQAEGLWRYQLLAGGEVTTFSASQYSTHVEPIVQGNVTWTPLGTATVSGSVSRSFSEPLAQGNNGFFLNQGSLRVDFELMRNVLLHGQGGTQYAEYLGGGTQFGYNFATGVNWLLNRNARISFDYSYYHQGAASDFSNMSGAGGVNGNAFSQSIGGVTIHIAL